MIDKFKVSELFSSIDGEGKRVGLPATFIRLTSCNLECSYCDSNYAVHPEENDYNLMSLDDILDTVKEVGWKNITVTGGEPLIHSNIDVLLSTLSNKGYDVNVETNGSVRVDQHRYRNVWFTVDYKCPSSGMIDKMIYDQFYTLSDKDVIKFVVGSEKDLKVATECAIDFHKHTGAQIYFSPVFNTISYETIVNHILNNKLDFVKFQVQLHKIVWDPNKRGV